MGGGNFFPPPLRIEEASSSFLALAIKLSNPLLNTPATLPCGDGGLGGCKPSLSVLCPFDEDVVSALEGDF